MSEIHFGVSPIAWINDDMPELGGNTPVETVLADARDLGFSGVELGGKFPKDPVTLRALLERYQLDLVGGWYSASLLQLSAADEIARLQPHLELLKAMKCTVFICAETSNAIHGNRSLPLSKTPRLGEKEWVQFGARLTDVADYIAAQGLRFAYHHHLGTVVERPGDVERLVRNTGTSVGLTVDTGHAALAGLDPLAVIGAYPSRVAHVHCKDVRRQVFGSVVHNDNSFLDGVLAGMFTVPGDGDLDFGAVMKALFNMRYSGWIIVEAEQDPAKAPPRQYARVGLRSLQLAAGAARISM